MVVGAEESEQSVAVEKVVLTGQASRVKVPTPMVWVIVQLKAFTLTVPVFTKKAKVSELFAAAVKVTIPVAEPFVVVSGATLNVTEVIDCAVELGARAITLA